jgi:site-specific recombinase XerD
MEKIKVYSHPTQNQPSFIDSPDIIKRYKKHLKNRGHTDFTRQSYLSAIKHFLFWVENTSHYFKPIDRESIKMFIEKHLPDCRCPGPVYKNLNTVRAALNQMLSMQGGHERVRTISNNAPTSSELDIEIGLFDEYLEKVCGHAQSTRWYHRRHARKFLLWLFKEQTISKTKITPEALCRFVSEQASTLRPNSVGVLVYSLRTYLKFLQFHGQATPSLKGKIPRPPGWSQTNLPQALNEAELKRFWSVFNRSTSIGKRDYAMARCMADLGLRCHEVANLQCNDIDWHNGSLYLSGTKGRREEALPLPDQMGRALVTYLRYGRPITKIPNIFVYHRAPIGQAVQKATVRGAIRRAFSRAGLPWSGTHILRSTLASRFLERGASIKEVAEILRHRSIDTTKIYSKVDFSHLSQVALPWPGRRI